MLPWLLHLLRSPRFLWSAFGVFVLIVGFSGVPEDVVTWAAWIESTTRWLSTGGGERLILSLGLAIVVITNIAPYRSKIPVLRQLNNLAAPIAEAASRVPALVREPDHIEVISDGVLWTWNGNRDRDGAPILRSWCLQHRVPLQRINNGTGEINRWLFDEDFIDDLKAERVHQLYCAHNGGHAFTFDEPSFYKNPHLRAQAKAEAEQRKRQRESRGSILSSGR